MHIAVLTVELRLPLCHSLKEKRSVLKRAIHYLRSNHNVAVAETDHHDAWGSAQLSLVTVCNVKTHAEETLRQALDHLDHLEDAEVVGDLMEWL